MPELEKAPVTITLTGLLLFRFSDDMQLCNVGVHNKSEDHVLRIVVTENGKPEPIFEHSGPMPDDLLIEANQARFTGVKKHLVGDGLEKSEPTLEQEQDFRWLIDFEGPDFYDTKLTTDKNGLSPGICITNGLFYTFCQIDKEKFKAVRRVGGKKEPLELFSIAEVIGVNIYLDEEASKVILRWGRDGKPLAELVRSTPAASFEITITNIPPDPEKHSDSLKREGHFKRYFDVIKNIAQENQFDLKFTTKEGLEIPPSVLDVDHDVPCMSGGLGGGPR